MTTVGSIWKIKLLSKPVGKHYKAIYLRTAEKFSSLKSLTFCGKDSFDFHSRRRSQIMQISPREIQTIQCVNHSCKSVCNRLSNQSERDTRIWYHKTAALKECPQAPLSFFLAPYRAPLARLADFSFRPIPHLGSRPVIPDSGIMI